MDMELAFAHLGLAAASSSGLSSHHQLSSVVVLMNEYVDERQSYVWR